MADLSPLGYGRVKGRFLAGVEDSADAGLAPDVLPLSGRVIFKLSASKLQVVSASPVPATVYPQPVIGILDSEGYLTHNGQRFVPLLATNDPATNPTNLQWTATFELTFNGLAIPAESWNFELPLDSLVDLSEVAPLASPAPNTVITKGEPAGPGLNGTPLIPTKYYAGVSQGLNTQQLAVNTMRAGILQVGRTCSLNEIGIEVTTAGSAGSVARLGIYKVTNWLTGLTELLVDAGTVDATSTGFKSIAINVPVTVGDTLLLAYVSQGNPTTLPILRGQQGGVTAVGFETPLVVSQSLIIGSAQLGITGALPSTHTLNASGSVPRVLIKTNS